MRAEKPKFTSWPVRPCTSFEAWQSSRIMSTLVPSKSMLTRFNQISTSCCSHIITNIRGSFSPKRYRILLCAKVGQISTMYSNLPRKGPHSCFTRNWVFPEFVGPTMRALNGMLFGSMRLAISIHDRLKSIIQNVEQRVRKDENVAFNGTRSRPFSLYLKVHSAIRVVQSEAAAVHFLVLHRT